MKSGRFSSCPGQAGSRLFKAESRQSWDNVFHINISSRNEKCFALLNFSLYIKIKDADQSCWKNDSPKVYEHTKKFVFTAANGQTS